MSVEPVVRCNPCQSSCDSLEQLIQHFNNHHLDAQSSDHHEIKRSQLLLQTETIIDMKPLKAEVSSVINPVLRKGANTKQIVNETGRMLYGCKDPNIPPRRLTDWNDSRNFLCDSKEDHDGPSTVSFTCVEFSCDVTLPSKSQSRLGMRSQVTMSNLPQAFCLVKRLTAQELQKHNYEQKGNKFVPVKAQCEQKSGGRGRPSNATKKKVNKSYNEPKNKNAQVAKVPIPTATKFKPSRLCRGEEFTLYLRAPKDGWSWANRFRFDLGLTMDEEVPEICDPFDKPWSDDETSNLPYDPNEFDALIGEIPYQTLLEAKMEREIAKQPKKLEIIPSSRSVRKLLNDECGEATSRGRSNESQTPVDPVERKEKKSVKKSRSRNFVCDRCKTAGTFSLQGITAHNKEHHPDMVIEVTLIS